MTETIFERYGGFVTLRKVVSAFYDRVLASELTGPYFVGVDMQRLVDHQTKFVAFITGGPASYSDETIERAHRPLEITGAAFAEIARILRETLEEFGLEEHDIESVCAEFLRRREVIVAVRG